METNEKKNQVKDLTDRLKKGVEEVFTSGKYAAYLEMLAKFHNYSFRNCLLIAMQDPTASRVASYKKWQELGRQVRKGEKGIKILVPLFRKKANAEDADEEPERLFYACKVGNVFDIAQTDGDELPEIAQSLNAEVVGYAEIIRKLESVSPLPVIYQTLVNENAAVRGGTYYGEHIAIKGGMSEADKIKTLIHEIAHAVIHDGDEEKDRHTKEVEAESIAYVVSAALGIDASQYSFGYVANWGAEQTAETLTASLETIRNTANEILKQYEAA